MSLEILTCYIQPKPMNTTPHSHHISQLNVCAQIPQQQQPSALQQNFSPSRRTVKIRAVSTREELVHALSLRAKVYIHELHHSSTNHFDEFDNWPLRDGVTHYLVIVDKVAIGTCRLNTLSAGVNLERLAVDSRVRRRGVGHALLRHLERLPIIVNSQGPYFCHALKDQEFFFFSSGWVVEEGHDVDEQKYPTIAMVRRRRPCGAAAMGCKSLSHVMVRTIDISSARKFYSLLGFQDVSRFKVNGVRGVWIESPFIEQRIELLEVKTLAPAGDPKLVNMSSLSDYTPGLGHISIDLSRVCTDLTRFLLTMQKESVSRFSIAISLLQKPQKMMLGSTVMEVAFITDADRTILELVRFVKKVEDRPEYDAEW